AAYQRGDFEDAALAFDNPIWRGNALYRAGKFRQAIAAYQEDDSATAYYNRGNALVQLGELDSAKEAYLAALAQEPGHEDALYNLSLLQGQAASAPEKTDTAPLPSPASPQSEQAPLP
ncbi:tetratricopeptide repeat protein, partial [Aeromonas enteropelogenes]|uniref:tetratricopeptide repeat protein n=1 Tax=Aeromonas enteropelogenes TaxID=29489 RepID=UPI0021AAB03B